MHSAVADCHRRWLPDTRLRAPAASRTSRSRSTGSVESTRPSRSGSGASNPAGEGARLGLYTCRARDLPGGYADELHAYDGQVCRRRAVDARVIRTPMGDERWLTVRAVAPDDRRYVQGRGVRGVLSIDAGTVIDGLDRGGIPYVKQRAAPAPPAAGMPGWSAGRRGPARPRLARGCPYVGCVVAASRADATVRSAERGEAAATSAACAAPAPRARVPGPR